MPDLFPNVDSQVVADFKAHRKAKKAPINATAIAGIEREAQKAGITLQDALTLCCTRGWVGFKAEWVTQPSRASPQSRQEKTQNWINELTGKSHAPDHTIIDV